MKKTLLSLFLVCIVIILAGCACKHENTEIINAVEATCTSDGYSGDTYCNDCKKTIKEGEKVVALGHNEGEAENVVEATCIEEGYTGDVFCTRCGELLKEGTRVHVLEHTPGELMNIKEASCSEEGYTGDVYCSVCGMVLEWGEPINKVPHKLKAPVNVIEATCKTTGYTGDRECEVCGEMIPGETIGVTDHNFENNICTVCGWHTPGLYNDGAMTMKWEDLENNGYVEVSDGVLISTSGNFGNGTLVIGEDVTRIGSEYSYYSEF